MPKGEEAMSLEFHKLTQQVEQMSQALVLTERELEDKAELARQLLMQYGDAEALPHVDARVMDAVAKDAGYRGARPLYDPLDEPIAATYPLRPASEAATLVVTDGSQIFPDLHGPALYYLLNVGTIVWHRAGGGPPDVIGEPYLYYDPEYLMNPSQGVISNGAVSARRTVEEMKGLATHTWANRGAARPLLALLDGPLVFFMGIEVPEREFLLKTYLDAMKRAQKAQAALIGYLDRPRSSFIVSLLHLLDTPPEEVSRRALATDGSLEGLTDSWLFRTLLEPGSRTALFVQMSPANKAFKDKGGKDLEICFFYMNVAAPGERPLLARIEIPRWVADDRDLVAEVQALLYDQCQQLINRYPYLLTRADEVAVVRHEEQRQLEMMIKVALTRCGVEAAESEKQSGKGATRTDKTRHEI
jgi:hypothetical protein